MRRTPHFVRSWWSRSHKTTYLRFSLTQPIYLVVYFLIAQYRRNTIRQNRYITETCNLEIGAIGASLIATCDFKWQAVPPQLTLSLES